MTDNLKIVLEAILFASEKPVTAEHLRSAFEEEVTAGDIRIAMDALKTDYEVQSRGFRLFEIAGGYQILTNPDLASYVKRFYQSREKKKFSQASLETLSVIAYKQPVTRADIEFVRGVNVDGALKNLMEKGLVQIVGRKEVPGRPMLYGTTKEFLEHFALPSLKELPPLSEFTLKDIEPHLLPPQLQNEVAEEASVVAEAEEIETRDEEPRISAEEGKSRLPNMDGMENERG